MATLALAILLTSVLLAGFPGGLTANQGEPPEEGAAAPVAVHVEGGLVSVDVRDEPLADVLRAIAQQAGVELEVHSGGDDRVTDSFDDVRVGESIQRLARGHDVILVFGAASDGAARGRLVAAHVYEASAPAATVPTDPKQRAAHLREVRQLIRQARQKQPGAVNSLIALLSSDPDPTIRRTAASALGSIGGPEAVAALTTALNDQEASVRVSALTALGRRREESAVPSLAQVAARDSEASVRRAAVWALSSLRSDEARRAIEGAASDPDSSVRRAAQGASRIWQQRNARAN
jgi:hypothetical protein